MRLKAEWSARITAPEWRWAIGWSIIILILSVIPYLIAILLTPAGWQFAGIIVNPYDAHSYLAKMQQGLQGNWLFHLTYTPEPHDGAFIFLFYLALGHLARMTTLPLIWIFHLARLVTGLGLLLVGYYFISHITAQTNERRLAFVLLFSSSGLGWLGAIFGALPVDLWVPEGFVPYSLYANPHFPLGLTLMMVILLLAVRSGDAIGSKRVPDAQETRDPEAQLRFRSWSSIFGAGLAALALAIVLPFALITVWAILASFLIWLYVAGRRLPWPHLWPTLGVGIFSAPVIGYDYWVSTSNPILTGWSAQNVTTAPPILDFLLGYGLVGLLAIVGGWQIVRSKQRDLKLGEWLVLWWAVVTIVLVYLPLDLQRRLINGLHIPLCILAAIGLTRWLSSSPLKISHRRWLTTAVVTTGAIGTFFVWTIPLLGMRQPPTESDITGLFFLRREEIIALRWLRKNSTPNDVVLASPRLGTFVPGQTGSRVFYGHPFETIEAKVKKETVEAFYRGEVETVSPPVDFIIYGPSEQALGQPQKLSNYPIVFEAHGVSIYKITQ